MEVFSILKSLRLPKPEEFMKCTFEITFYILFNAVNHIYMSVKSSHDIILILGVKAIVMVFILIENQQAPFVSGKNISLNKSFEKWLQV